MYLARKIAYNKKRGTFNMAMLNAYPNFGLTFNSLCELSVYFFITITNRVRSNKMIEMYLRILIIKILLCILSPPSIME